MRGGSNMRQEIALNMVTWMIFRAYFEGAISCGCALRRCRGVGADLWYFDRFDERTWITAVIDQHVHFFLITFDVSVCFHF